MNKNFGLNHSSLKADLFDQNKQNDERDCTSGQENTGDAEEEQLHSNGCIAVSKLSKKYHGGSHADMCKGETEARRN